MSWWWMFLSTCDGGGSGGSACGHLLTIARGPALLTYWMLPPHFSWCLDFYWEVFFAKRIMCRQAKGRGPRKQLMTSVSTYVARLPYSRSNCAEVTGNNEMSSTGVWKHKEAHRPDIDAGCILGGKMAFLRLFKNLSGPNLLWSTLSQILNKLAI